MFRYLDSLWISHVRSLLQVIHDSTFGRDVTQILTDMITQLRAGVQTILSNMVRSAPPFPAYYSLFIPFPTSSDRSWIKQNPPKRRS
jgi:hypothetical protein